MTIELITRIVVAALLGGIIGFEREFRAKEAGFRTHSLVALGSALFMLISQFGFADVLTHDHVSLDPSRVAAQVVSGIGFIGAGTIIFQKQVVRGLTTAAGLWTVSAIGLTCGSGMYVLAIAATVLVLLSLELMHFINKRFGSKHLTVTFSAPSQEAANNVLAVLRKQEVDVESYQMKERETAQGKVLTITMEMKVRRENFHANLFEFMAMFDGVTIENLE